MPASNATRAASPAHAPAALRALAVARVRERLVAQSFPRLQMALIVALAGGCGLLASFALLHTGLESMALRYPLALGLAYLCLLGLIGLWLRTTADDWLDAGHLPDLLPRPGSCGNELVSGGGGDFGGGGASGSFDAPQTAALDAADSPLREVGDALGSGPDLDDLAIPLAAIGVLLAMALAALYVVWIAPVLLAEVLVDGALAYALLRHLRGQDPQHWLASTWRRTWVPALATGLFLAAMGAALAWHTPGAHTIGQALGRTGPTSQAGR